ncbi:MAG: YihY/virulence factor BrkB family protein [Pyrinomonadaceae bacterium]
MKVPDIDSLKRILHLVYERVFATDVPGNAAQVGFYFSFAIFPLLLFLISLLGIVLANADDLRAELFVYLGQLMPSSAFELVRSTLDEIKENSSGSKLTIGVVATLWSASAGIDALRQALNQVYGEKERRSWWHTKLQSLVLTVLFVLLIAAGLGLAFYGEQVLDSLMRGAGLGIISTVLSNVVQWALLLFVLAVTTAVIYSWLPAFDKFEWVWITPGGVVAILLFALLTTGFRVYLHYFNSYDKTYGSLGAVIILMLWLYLTAMALLVGGAINAVLNDLEELPDSSNDVT